MARKDRKRQRRDQKKKRKKFDGSSLSQLHRIASRGKVLAAYITDTHGDEGEGMCSVMVLRQGPEGRHVMGAFLIDFWCLGLKDAFGRIGVSEADLAEQRERMVEGGVQSRAITLEVARQLVAGAIRWTREKGFKLPPQTDRWLTVLGDGLPIADADLGRFGGPNGKLHYEGTVPDLIKRLPDGDMNKFMQRSDTEVTFVLPDEDDEFADGILAGEDEEAALEAELGALAEKQGEQMLSVALRWCRDQGVTPHPRLGEAAQVMLLATLTGMTQGDEEGTDEPVAFDLLNAAVEHDPGLRPALDQIRDVFADADSAEAFAAALETAQTDG
ncbi:MAG: hypothetical protein GVY24_01155 [Planctomycetes bacterium]|jgi:GNAT superfamily N-acetyltransferase|nr:hypothetical protein [Planctomycetota bacterium]